MFILLVLYNPRDFWMENVGILLHYILYYKNIATVML